MTEPRFTIVKDKFIRFGRQARGTGVLIATFEDSADVNSYCGWRNNPTPKPRFQVGDRVIVHGVSVPQTVTRVATVYDTTRDPGSIGEFTQHSVIESTLELAPSEPPKWEVRHYADWFNIERGDEHGGRLRVESVANQVRDLLN